MTHQIRKSSTSGPLKHNRMVILSPSENAKLELNLFHFREKVASLSFSCLISVRFAYICMHLYALTRMFVKFYTNFLGSFV